ncbi:hypothetical protein ACJMK2_033921 [Sinanodonta woodiana]|uniref:Uncharacterized protein n=1 Tax=Sinanodonta woodiana TaxID=1069815 RepID=A0ABD3WPY2_SINWO
MPIRYVGRESFFKGKTLFEIACSLKNFGENRVVYRYKWSRVYPEKSFYRLTRVIPDLTNKGRRKGEAYGLKVFRGEEFKECKIEAGMKADWRLVPKEEEEEFCKLTHQPREKKIVPKYNDFPPLFAEMIKQQYKDEGRKLPEPFKLLLKINKSINNRSVLAES